MKEECYDQIPQRNLKTVVCAHIQEGQTLQSLASEYGISRATISNWVRAYREKCESSMQKSRKRIASKKKPRHSSQRKSISSISIHPRESRGIWRPLVVPADGYSSELLLQLSKESQGGLPQR